MSAGSAQNDRTTLWVSSDTHSRLSDLKPYDSMSFDDLLTEMADIYEESH